MLRITYTWWGMLQKASNICEISVGAYCPLSGSELQSYFSSTVYETPT